MGYKGSSMVTGSPRNLKGLPTSSGGYSRAKGDTHVLLGLLMLKELLKCILLDTSNKIPCKVF
jgi:hypothetical protein